MSPFLHAKAPLCIQWPDIVDVTRYWCLTVVLSLRKHAYLNILKILPQKKKKKKKKFYHKKKKKKKKKKNENFQIKNSNIFPFSAQNINYGYSLEPPRWDLQSMFVIRNKKNNVYPCKPQFYYIKVGFNGVKII